MPCVESDGVGEDCSEKAVEIEQEEKTPEKYNQSDDRLEILGVAYSMPLTMDWTR